MTTINRRSHQACRSSFGNRTHEGITWLIHESCRRRRLALWRGRARCLVAAILLAAGAIRAQPAESGGPSPAHTQAIALRAQQGGENDPAPSVTPGVAATPTTNGIPEAAVVTLPPLEKSRIPKNQISASADFLLGQGTVTLPVGYSLNKSVASGIPLSAASVNRSSEYFGATVSYSRGEGQPWFIDLSYVQGDSSGNQSISVPFNSPYNSSFSIKDDWYEAYFRYTFPSLRFTKYQAYLRAGVNYVTAKLQDNAFAPANQFDVRYSQTDNTTDLTGNVGFGFIWWLHTARKLKYGLQAEGEGFYGYRSQHSLESLPADAGVNFVPDDFSNTLYGGVGRATVRVEYGSGRLKGFADAGFQMRYTEITYPGEGASPSIGTKQEELYGPYIKLGLRYNF
jgi:hypothetical protein